MAFVRTHYNIATAAFLSLLLLLLSIFCSGCSDEFKNRKALEKMLGQEIRFPDSLRLINQDKFIPKSSSFHAFLLDRNDRIALVGDPTRNLQILELYIKSLPDLAEAKD